jgi:hypothetical protein
MLRRLEAGQYGSIPAWVFESDDPLDRRKAIESIRTDDVFKSQFRSPKSSLKSGPSPIEVIDWGLEHLERLRRAEEERKESQWKWFKEGLIPILSVIVALGTVIITFYFQYQNIQAQKEMKEYEVSFKPKQETYTSFVKAASAAFEYAFYGDKGNLQKSLSSMETNLFVMESLIKSDSGKLRLWKEYHEYHEYLRNLSQIKSEDINEQNYLKSFEEHRNLFGKLKEDVYQELFQGD